MSAQRKRVGAVSRVTIPTPHGRAALPCMDGRARECLERATYCRQLAEGERDPEMRAYLLKLTADWVSAAKKNFHENRRMESSASTLLRPIGTSPRPRRTSRGKRTK